MGTGSAGNFCYSVSDLQVGVYPYQKRNMHQQDQTDECDVDDHDETPGGMSAGCWAMIDESLMTSLHGSVSVLNVLGYTSGSLNTVSRWHLLLYKWHRSRVSLGERQDRHLQAESLCWKVLQRIYGQRL